MVMMLQRYALRTRSGFRKNSLSTLAALLWLWGLQEAELFLIINCCMQSAYGAAWTACRPNPECDRLLNLHVQLSRRCWDWSVR
jgi:hypothetical protein